MSKSVVVWFRRDLRIHDNPNLFLAAQAVKNKKASSVICCYFFDPREMKDMNPYGFRKTGTFRAKFVLESVQELRENLRKIGSDLHMSIDYPEIGIPALCQKLKVSEYDILCQDEIATEEAEVEANLKVNLPPGCSLSSLPWGSLFHPDDLPTPIDRHPPVYTPWRKKLENSGVLPRKTVAPPKRGELPLPANFHLGLEEVPSLADLGLLEKAGEVPKGCMNFRGGEEAGKRRLQEYFFEKDLLKNYKETRNGMLGADYSSKFSVWMAHGCLSPRYIYEKVKEYEQTKTKNLSTYWLIFEILWRDYFRFYFKRHGAKPFHLGGVVGRKAWWSKDQNLFCLWKEGRTGFPLIDANMRELNATGFMSNRGRQNVASFLIHDLGVDWRLGAYYFEEMLLDFDPCSNWGNWHALAGGQGGRLNRFNSKKQSKDYDPEGAFIKFWCPELSKVPPPLCFSPDEASPLELRKWGVELGKTYPLPVKVSPFTRAGMAERWGPAGQPGEEKENWEVGKDAKGRNVSQRASTGSTRGKGKQQKTLEDFFFKK